ncbi:LacI family DNA-binding transcriptional regulator [Saccharothrix sp. S26]|uniref:LacI family DNA-binding transcriptional regulator n=1 Tax=Saccharothrix sp. S26 TaxID=2907215 RepID=UPI001F3F2DDE|nr:LacI family DNA-binding transcriptional regulator [Saccharothrix sp. S26]MCE7000739.1 LacI family DNA-binding transcriptional regulator [Saccharothrix sp. S26]
MPARGRGREAAPSIRDVAAAAGASHQTVSRVLDESPDVDPDTRRQVLDVIERLGSRPNRAAVTAVSPTHHAVRLRG